MFLATGWLKSQSLFLKHTKYTEKKIIQWGLKKKPIKQNENQKTSVPE